METIIGHKEEIKILDMLVSENKVAHAYLFSGKDGIGKKLVATYFANQLIGDASESNIKMITAENDIIKVEEIREVIAELYLKPTDSAYKVVVIDEADKMNANAQNALLKILEEPPTYAVLILITSNKEKIIKTILSRVTEIKFHSLSDDDLKKIVGEDVNLELARGSAKRAFQLKESESAKLANEFYLTMQTKNFLSLNKEWNAIKSSDANLLEVLELTKVMCYKDLKNGNHNLVDVIMLIDETIKNLKRNANEDLAIDKFMIEVCKKI